MKDPGRAGYLGTYSYLYIIPAGRGRGDHVPLCGKLAILLQPIRETLDLDETPQYMLLVLDNLGFRAAKRHA